LHIQVTNLVILVRSGGDLVEAARVDGVSGTHNGACTGHENIRQGIIYSEFDLAHLPDETFRIFQSNVSIR